MSDSFFVLQNDTSGLTMQLTNRGRATPLCAHAEYSLFPFVKQNRIAAELSVSECTVNRILCNYLRLGPYRRCINIYIIY